MKSVPKTVGSQEMPAKAKPDDKGSPKSAKVRSVPTLNAQEEALLEVISTSENFNLEKVLKRHPP